MKRGLSWHFYATLLIVANIAITVFAFYVKNVEYAYEMADLQAMHSALQSAVLKWKDKLPDEPVEFWYDAAAFSLVPASDNKPLPSGAGTQRFGGAKKDFQQTSGLSFVSYNESESYIGKLPHVTVYGENGELMVSVDWVDAE